MNILVIGLSHRSAPMSLLERVSLDAERVRKLVLDTVGRSHTDEAVAVSTCNRVEVYAAVERFHGGVEALTETLSVHTGVPAVELMPHLFVRYEDAAVDHLFSLTCGLDSMVVGEPQILGQVKAALRIGQEAGTVGPTLNGLFQSALRVGKRAQSETDLDRVGPSLVDAALAAAAAAGKGASARPTGSESSGASGSPDLADRPVSALVIGAGSMAVLAVNALVRDHRARVVIANRTPERAERLAAQVAGRAVGLADVQSRLGAVDMVLTCTAASGVVLTYDQVRNGRRGAEDRTLTVIDLAMPRNVDPAVAELPGVELIDLDRLDGTATAAPAESLDQVREIVGAEVAGFNRQRRAATATPTVVALREMAAGVVEAELRRLRGRLPELDEAARSEVETAMRRTVEKVLHVPTVRVKELSELPVEVSYTEALRELFALDPKAPAALEALPDDTGEQAPR